MRLTRTPPLWTSVLLHLAVCLAFLLYLLVQAFWPKPKPHVFQMVALAPAASLADVPASPEVPTLPELPTLPPTPKPTAPPQQRVAPRSEPPAPKIISHAEFLKKNPIQAPRQPQVRAPQRPRLTTPTLEVPQLITSNTPQQALSAAQVSALQQFQSRLWALLNQAWRQPEGLGGFQLSALVNFEVSPSGAIAKVRLSSSSGNASFDASVLAAFRRVGRAGPTPTGRTHQFRMPFRLR